MMKLDTTHAFLKEDVKSYQEVVNKYHEQLMKRTGKGNDFVGWVEWPHTYDKEEFDRMKKVAQKSVRNVMFVLFVVLVVLIWEHVLLLK